MLDFFRKYLLSGFVAQDDPMLHRKIIISSAFLIVIFLIFAVFIVINIRLNNYLLVIVDLVMIASAGVSLYFLCRRKNIEFATIFATALLFSFLILFTLIDKNQSFGLVWTICFPLFVLPTLGIKRGFYTIILFYLILFPIAYLGIGEWDHGNWDSISFIRFFSASIVVVYATYFFEASTLSANDELSRIREQEKIYLEKLESLSATDQLTGLFNRRYFDANFAIELRKMTRYGKHLSLIMIDVDNFKNVNDTYGHQIGDQVLIEISQILLLNIRVTDLLARWGGEEFIVLLPETSAENAKNVAEKVRLAVAEHHFDKISQQSASFGVAEVLISPSAYRDAINHADAALYQAKNQGRNKVVLFSS